MDKDFLGGSKETAAEKNTSTIVTSSNQRKSLSTEASSEKRKENETNSVTTKSVLSKSDPFYAHRHGIRGTASHSTIEHLGLGEKSADLKRSGSTGQARSKSFWEQLPAVAKGPSSMRVSFNGKKGTHGSHGDGLTQAHGKGLLLNDSLEKGEDQPKKQHILHPGNGLNSAPVAQRVFNSSLSFADLVRACGQRQKPPTKLDCGQLNNSLLSTPQSSTLVSNYFNKYRSYLDHLRKTHGYPKPDSEPAGIRPPDTNLALPLPCIPPVILEENIHDPEYVQILEKTTTDSIRNLWSYQLEGGEAERVLLQCDSNPERRVVPDRQGSSQRRFCATGEAALQSSEACDRKQNYNQDSHTTLNTKSNCISNNNLKSDCPSSEFNIYSLEKGSSQTEIRNASDFDSRNTEPASDTNQVNMKNNMASLLPAHQQHNGAAEWGDSHNDRKTMCVGYSLKTRNDMPSSIGTMTQKQQRMLQQKQDQQQQPLQQHTQADNSQSDATVSQPQSTQPQSTPNSNNSIGSKMLQGAGNPRHKICSRFQGMGQQMSGSASATAPSVSLAVASEQSRLSQSNSLVVTSSEHGGQVNNVQNGIVGTHQNPCNGIYPVDNNIVSADPAVIPSMSGSMTYSRTLKASYACLDPNSAMPMTTKDSFRENVFGEAADHLSLPDSFQQMPETLGGDSKWIEFQNRQQASLNNDKSGDFVQNSDSSGTTGQARSRIAIGFSEPEPPQHWSASLKSGSQRPINKITTKDSPVESYLSFCNHKEKNSTGALMGLNSAPSDTTQSVGQKLTWGSSFNRLEASCDVGNDVTFSQSNDLSRLHQWRLHTPSTFEASKATNDSTSSSSSFQHSLDPFSSTKSSWSTCGDVSPNKNVLKYLHQRSHNASGGAGHMNDGVGVGGCGGPNQHSYQASRLTDQRHKLFNNNNASSIAMVNDKGRPQIENGTFMSNEPWSSATCDDMTEYFDSTLQFAKTGMTSSHNNGNGMTMDNTPSRCLSQSSSSVTNSNLMSNFTSPAFRCNDSYNPLQIGRPTSTYPGQKDDGSFPTTSSSHEQQKKQIQNSNDYSFLPHDNTGLGDCNSLDIAFNDASPPWYEIAPIPEDMEEIRNDKSREQNKLGNLNFLESSSSERDNQFSARTVSSEISYPLHQNYNTSISSSNQSQNTYGISKFENKPRLILGASTINQRQHVDTERESSMIENDKNRMIINSAAAIQDSDKFQNRKQYPFPCHPKLGSASTSQISASHFQQPQFQISGVNHQQTTNGVPQQMYCIPNILMPPPQHQGQGRHPGMLSYPGMMGNVAPSSPFPQGLMRVPLVDMSRLVYLQSLPFSMASTNLTPNSNHNNSSSSSNPHVNTSNIITINTTDNDFSATGDKGGGRPTKPAGIRGKSTLLRLRSNNGLGESAFSGLRSTEDPTLLNKANKLRSNNGNPWDADLEHDFSSSLFSKVTSLQDQSRMQQEFGLVYPETQTAPSNAIPQEGNFRSASGVQWPSSPDIHPEMLDMLPVRKQPIEDYNNRQVCWTDMELMMSSAAKEQMQVVRKSNKPLGSNKANLISILPKIYPGEMIDPKCKESAYE